MSADHGALRSGPAVRDTDEAVDQAVAELQTAGAVRTRAHRLLAEMRLLAPFPEMRSPLDAMSHARAAVTIDPENPDNLAVLAHVMALTGRDAEAVQTIEQALRRNPSPPDWYRHVAGMSYLIGGNPARAAETFGSLHGAGTFTGTRWWPGWLFAASLAQSGRMEEAMAPTAKEATTSPNSHALRPSRVMRSGYHGRSAANAAPLDEK